MTTQKQSSYHFKYSILIASSQEKVWDFLTDVKRWKEWDTELKEAKLLEDFALNAKGVLTPKKGPKLKFYISEVVHNQSYTFKTKMPIGYLEIRRTLTKKDTLVEFTDDIQFTGILKKVFGVFLGSSFKTVLPEVMRNFKTLAEKE